VLPAFRRPPPASRLRLALPLLLAAVAFVLLAPNAGAFRQWCRSDPIVLIGGHLANIYVSSDPAILGQATGPTQVIVVVPVGVDTELIATDPGFGHGEVVTFAESRGLRTRADGTIEVIVTVQVPSSDRSLPVLVEFVPQGSGPLVAATAQGRVNGWVVLRSPS